jgi:ATP-binding cassette subfamily C (CFTR/MRP) protein 10
MLHGIRALKLLGWEGLYASLLGQSRRQEVKYLSQRKYLDAWCVYFWAATPVLTSMATFTAVALSANRTGHALTPASVFTTVSLLNMLIFPMNAFPWVINGLMEALVSKRRLQVRPAEHSKTAQSHIILWTIPTHIIS